jgi:protein gp37
MDDRYKRDPTLVKKTGAFDALIKKSKDGLYKIPSGKTLYTCFTSDFLLEEADKWRDEAWSMMQQRSDLEFFIITKRIDRLISVLPVNWGDGYPNITISCTVENQDRVDYRLPIFLKTPIKHKNIICEPLLERVDISKYLGPWIEGVSVGGESGSGARVCDYDWVLDIRRQCVEKRVPFEFRQTGARLMKNGKLFNIPRKSQLTIASKLNIDTA